MSGLKISVIIASFALAFMVPAARADEWNQKTELSFSQPVQLPGVVLPAGTYWFILGASSNNRNMVQVFSKNWDHIYATLFTVPAYRRQVTDNTEIEFAERPHDQPDAVCKWYYPGLTMGHEFLYPRREEQELARDATLDIVAQPMPA